VNGQNCASRASAAPDAADGSPQPIRTHYSPAESTTPGYFQTDTVGL
jgi:hypothetical protein